MRRSWWIRFCIETSLFICLVFFLLYLTTQNFYIDGYSMEPTLYNQEYVLVNKAAYLFQPPSRGDVIVFQYPLHPQINYIKRVIAVPGDVISVVEQTVSVNGVTLHESYVNKADPYNPYPPIVRRVVGPGEYFVMGDNRGNSSDSRQWGLVPRKNIIGKAVDISWPIGVNNLGPLPDVQRVFAHVP
ncbi:MAG TPA: signal peptidase I [Dictyobacter sp.]|jgi:signal peptidase I|nr:signal peptidase I [Dictyobacter sp.]